MSSTSDFKWELRDNVRKAVNCQKRWRGYYAQEPQRLSPTPFFFFCVSRVLVAARRRNTRVHCSYASMQSLLLGAPRPTDNIFRRYAHMSPPIFEWIRQVLSISMRVIKSFAVITVESFSIYSYLSKSKFSKKTKNNMTVGLIFNIL